MERDSFPLLNRPLSALYGSRAELHAFGAVNYGWVGMCTPGDSLNDVTLFQQDFQAPPGYPGPPAYTSTPQHRKPKTTTATSQAPDNYRDSGAGNDSCASERDVYEDSTLSRTGDYTGYEGDDSGRSSSGSQQSLSSERQSLSEMQEVNVSMSQNGQEPVHVQLQNPEQTTNLDSTDLEIQAIQTRRLEPGNHVTIRSEDTPSPGLPDVVRQNVPLPPYESPAGTLQRMQLRRMMNHEHYRRRSERDRSSPRPTVVESDSNCDKMCCCECITEMLRFRYVLIFLLVLGLICVITGIILGSLHMAGNNFLALSLMFIGLGALLVVVTVIGWRCTPVGHEPCHLLFSIGHYNDSRSASSTENRINRRYQWSGGIIYPEGHYRTPPPTYHASMQEYARRARRQANNLPNSPPPSYRSQPNTLRPGVQITFPNPHGNNSRPPTYRSTAGTIQRPAINQIEDRFEASELTNQSQENVTNETRIVLDSDSSEVPCEVISDSQPINAENGVPVISEHCQNNCSVSELAHVNDDDIDISVDVSVSISEPHEPRTSSPLPGNLALPVSNVREYGTAERRAVECFESILQDDWRDVGTLDSSRTTESNDVIV